MNLLCYPSNSPNQANFIVYLSKPGVYLLTNNMDFVIKPIGTYNKESIVDFGEIMDQGRLGIIGTERLPNGKVKVTSFSFAVQLVSQRVIKFCEMAFLTQEDNIPATKEDFCNKNKYNVLHSNVKEIPIKSLSYDEYVKVANYYGVFVQEEKAKLESATVPKSNAARKLEQNQVRSNTAEQLAVAKEALKAQPVDNKKTCIVQ